VSTTSHHCHTYNILLIEDDSLDEEIVRRCLAKAQTVFLLSAKQNLHGGLAALHHQSFDAVLLDLSLPDSFGMGTVHRVVEEFGTLPIIVLSGYDDWDFAREAIHAGVQDYLVKGEQLTGSLERSIVFTVERANSQSAPTAATPHQG